MSQELAAPGEMRQAQSFEFNFKNVEKQYESYSGINVKLRYASRFSPVLSFVQLLILPLHLSTTSSPLRLSHRYFLRVTVARRMGDVVKEREIWVHSYRMPPDANMAIKMEVGIEDCLHIEFEYNKAKCVVVFAFSTWEGS
jgi:vacuolar protein sorting-associated protein 26